MPLEVSGPISVLGSSGFPTRMRLGELDESVRGIRRQSSPAREDASRRCRLVPGYGNSECRSVHRRTDGASSKTMSAALPPSSSCTRLRLLAEARDDSAARRVAGHAILSMSICSAMCCRRWRSAPGRMLTTPGGMPTFDINCAIRSALSGVSAAGFNTIVLPAASAGPISSW